ncbi:MAG: PspC domain-containing protein [Liquorilactobacillus ghanensis]|jgi:phage shock protein PspC (stress-responsive transcriptional regulator)|uniref:Phage shock protein PspC N-terminal domain-containing protein n=1 Tax=Liquorilactobacillus ghanensis DSM 18630 TaxID=1423750 RepID=A0A0R1VUA9_9LACO|nr:PspC domain-containing protein [Liquorilactobacillus ghanensis]KRM06563.1 hypothetical protein FC89_GL000713 [Liquorilactobacillus ghanensis DSM 18630]
MNKKRKKLRRSDERIIAGVCGGLAEFLNFKPWIMRIIFLLLLIIPHVTWLTVSCYLILAVSMPPKLGNKIFNSFIFELVRSLFGKKATPKDTHANRNRKIIHDAHERDLKN